MGLVAQPVFKTGEAWQPHAGSVRLRGRSVPQNSAKQLGLCGAHDRMRGLPNLSRRSSPTLHLDSDKGRDAVLEG